MSQLNRIEAKGLVKSVASRDVVKGLSFTVEPGEIVSLLGPNGAGKTTTFRMLLGLVCPTAGTVSVAGHDPRVSREDALRVVGYVPEDPAFWASMSGRECLDFVGRIRGFSERELEQLAAPLIDTLDLHHNLDADPATYSHGTRKRLSLLLALFYSPSVLVLDEALSGLDPIVARAVMSLVIERARAGAAVLMASHVLPEVVRLSHRVLLLQRGTLIAEGEIGDLLRRHRQPDLESLFFSLTGTTAGLVEPEAGLRS
jgi:ABC-2 type transport system ATP-binding protein